MPKAGSTAYSSMQTQIVNTLVQQAEFAIAGARSSGSPSRPAEIDQQLTALKKKQFGGSDAKYEAALKQQGFTNAEVEPSIKERLLEQKLSAAVTKGARSPRPRSDLLRREPRLLRAARLAQGARDPGREEQAKARRADLRLAQGRRDVLSKTSYRSPIAGTVYSVHAHPTEFAEAGKVLLQMADLHRERVRAYFDEPNIGQLSLGQAIQIKWEAKPGKVWELAHVVRIPATVIGYTTRVVGEVLVDIDGDDDAAPEASVTVTVTTVSAPDTLSIPRDALYSESGKTYVFKVVKNELVKAPVTTGVQNLTQVSILSGLNEGDIVATGTTTGQPLQVDVPIKQVE